MDPLAFLSDDEGEATVEALNDLADQMNQMFNRVSNLQDELVVTSI